jgi:LysR family transcriptional regulator, transcription activator of glutamate synthase operon
VELRQLTYFEAVVRHGGFTRAAEALRIAQPAVSAQVRRLEAELGVALLHRTTRRVDLTEAGRLFLVRVRRVLAEIERGRGDLADLASVVRGRVVVGATAVLGGFDLPGALASFTRLHPGVEVGLRSGLVGPMLDELGTGGLDLVLGPRPTPLPEGLRTDRLAGDRLVVITPPGHRLAGRPRVGWDDLADETFVGLPPDAGQRTVLAGAAAAAGVEPRVRFEAGTPADVLALVAAGLGVALTVASVSSAPDVGVHELVGAPEHPPYVVIADERRPASAAARALAGHLRRTPHALTPEVPGSTS